jgi:acyl carrier protein
MSNREHLYQLISKLFDIPAENLSSESTRDEIQRWDSMGTIDLVAQIESAFSVQFNLLEVEDLHSVGILEESLREKGVEL